MIRNLKIWQKLALMCLFFSISLAILLYLLVSEKNIAINFANKEQHGSAYLVPLRQLMEYLPEHERQLATQGDVAGTTQKIETAFRNLAAQEAQHGVELKTAEKLAQLQSKWQTLQSQGAKADATNRQALVADVVAATRNLTSHAGDTSNLILAPDLDSYYVMDLVLLKLPEHQDTFARLWQVSAGLVARNAITTDERVQLLLLLGQAKANVAAANTTLAVSNNASGSLQSITAASREHQAQSGAFLKLLEERLANSGSVSLTSAELNSAANQALGAGFRFWDAANPALQTLLSARVQGFNKGKYTALAFVGIVFLFTILLVLVIIRSITRPLQDALRMAASLSAGKLTATVPAAGSNEVSQLLHTMNTMNEYLSEMAGAAGRIAQGDLSAQVTPLSEEDVFGNAFAQMSGYLGRMAQVSDRIAQGDLAVKVEPKSAQDRFGQSFRNMLERTLRLVQSQDERDRIQSSIMKLLEEVSDVASGDLTVRAEVTADMTGSIADAFNMMIGELRQLIYKVKDTTLQVNQSAEAINSTTTDLAKGSEFQAAQISSTSEAVQLMVNSIQQVSQNATQSAEVAQQSLFSSRKGAEAVYNNISAMARVRDQVQETTARIKRLGERSQEIGSSVQLIKDIANRTSMLALNASIQAGMAGAEGRGFVVVAEEIENLAERATKVTKQITTLIHTIQSETKDVLTAMESTTREVSTGSLRANEAGQALNEIEAISQHLAQLIQSISQESQRQARGSDAIAKSMNEISNVTRRVSKGSQQAASSVRLLVSLAEELRSSIVPFRLPEKLETNSPGTPTYLDTVHQASYSPEKLVTLNG